MLNKILINLLWVSIGILIGYLVFADPGDSAVNSVNQEPSYQYQGSKKTLEQVINRPTNNKPFDINSNQSKLVKSRPPKQETEAEEGKSYLSVASDTAVEANLTELSDQTDRGQEQNWNYSAGQLINGPLSEILFDNDIWIEQSKCDDNQCLVKVAADVNNRRFPVSISNAMSFISKQSGFTPAIKSIQQVGGQWVAQIELYQPGAPPQP